MKKTILLSITLIFVLGLTGCGVDNYMENKVENEMEKSLGQNVEVDMDGGEIKIETEDGIMIEAGENVDLPSDFPEENLVIILSLHYPDWKQESAKNMQQNR